mmetsp:Transcript_16658/g.33159  ORF Transcript_16658/g.33159 Transcript_16658/m.33159 type:complete len:550 (-) Transcript_16658:185-1834(-)
MMFLPRLLRQLLLGAFVRRCSALVVSPPLLEIDTLVIGGGVSGLTSAFYAHKGGASTLLADSDPTRLGGVIETQQRDGSQWEDGPNTFQASAMGLRRLAADLGLAVVASDPALPRFVLGAADGALYALPAELPRLLSPWGLLRAAAGLLLLPVAPPDDDDETVASFVARVCGGEVLQKVVEPFLSTVYTGDPAALSLASVFPSLGRLAAAADGTPGGLLHCFVVAKNIAAADDRRRKSIDWNAVGNAVDAGRSLRPDRDYGALPEVPKGSSLSFAAGLRALPEAVRTTLGAGGCRLGWTALSVRPAFTANPQEKERFDVRFATPEGEKVVRAWTVIVATPAAAAAALLAPVAPAAADLKAIQAPPVVAVTLAYPKSALAPTKAVDGENLRGFGLLIPRSAGIETLGFQFISSLFPSRVRAGEQVVLAYYGGAQCSVDLDTLSDAEIVDRVHADAERLLLTPNWTAPRVLSVRRWQEGIPQYGVGHARLVEAVRGELPRTKRGGVLLGGAGAGGGISLGDCAEGGYACAQAALDMSRYRAAMSAASVGRG